MGGTPKKPEGPDLTHGIDLRQLPDEQPFLGQLNGEQLLLVRRGAEVFAVGAKCSHYGAALAEGVAIEETIRCPWHHACFSLRTGEAVGPPALKPIPTWEVEVRDGMAHFGSKHKAEALDSLGRTAEGPESVVIVGAGAAGGAAAEMLRREGYTGPVSLVDPEPDAPYDRPNLSKDYLAGNAPEEWIPLRSKDFFREHGIDRVIGSVQAIDTKSRTVTLTGGRMLPYGALLLATGATPSRLAVPGTDLAHVHLLRSLADCRAIVEGVGHAKRAVVIGASFIGMEVAAALRERSVNVTVVAPDAVPFARTLGEELGAFLKQLHETHGVEFRLGRTVSAVLEDRVRLDDGSEVVADLVVVGIGVRPDVRLAEEAGLEVDHGVHVDEYLETGAPGVFAAGDIASWPDPRTGDRIRVEHWVVAQRQGQQAARNILGHRDPFIDIPFFWTQQYDVTVAYVGHASEWDRIDVDGNIADGDCAVRYYGEGVLLAVATIGRDRESLRLEAAMRAGHDAPDACIAPLATGGVR